MSTIQYTLITTEVTPLSTQKYVSDLRAYCSENFLIISIDFSDGSTAKKVKNHNQKKKKTITIGINLAVLQQVLRYQIQKKLKFNPQNIQCHTLSGYNCESQASIYTLKNSSRWKSSFRTSNKYSYMQIICSLIQQQTELNTKCLIQLHKSCG